MQLVHWWTEIQLLMVWGDKGVQTVRNVTVPALTSWVKQDFRSSKWKNLPTWQHHALSICMIRWSCKLTPSL